MAPAQTTDSMSDRYMIVSADGHAGADLQDYKPYLARRWFEEFDAWAEAFRDPWLEKASTRRGAAASVVLETNWDSTQRQAALESQGIVAEVLFPNTYPPFYPTSAVFAPNPVTQDEYEHRSAGLQAHNRWLADVKEARSQ
jgi:hypothetical protein